VCFDRFFPTGGGALRWRWRSYRQLGSFWMPLEERDLRISAEAPTGKKWHVHLRGERTTWDSLGRETTSVLDRTLVYERRHVPSYAGPALANTTYYTLADPSQPAWIPRRLHPDVAGGELRSVGVGSSRMRGFCLF
jgi:hypothetical protein